MACRAPRFSASTSRLSSLATDNTAFANGGEIGDQGLQRVYWQTHESNATGRRLYDRVAENEGFIVYSHTL